MNSVKNNKHENKVSSFLILIPCSPDQKTNFETKNPIFLKLFNQLEQGLQVLLLPFVWFDRNNLIALKIRENSRFMVSELVARNYSI